MKKNSPVLTRHDGNPLLHADTFPGLWGLASPSPAVVAGKTVLLLSAHPCLGDAPKQTWVATSDDGIAFDVRPEPFMAAAQLPEGLQEYGDLYDNRITCIDGTYYILTQLDAGKYDRSAVLLGRTTDFESYEAMELISAPRDPGASLFPGRVDGQYLRIVVREGKAGGGAGALWLCASPDLLHWGDFRWILASHHMLWCKRALSATPPIATEEGWLVIAHGVHDSIDGPHYAIGALLLDRAKPDTVLGITHTPLLTPEAPYETAGHNDNRLASGGALADAEKDEITVYYSAADTAIAVATGKLSEVVAACRPL